MAATRQKPAAMLSFKRGGRAVVPKLPPIPLQPYEPPAGLSDYAGERWHRFWQTPVSGLVDMNRDGEALFHWIECVDQRRRLWLLWEKQPVIMDKNGDVRTNPLLRQILALTAMIERAETHFGLTPLAKMRMTGVLDQEQAAVESIEKRARRKPTLLPAKAT